MNIKEEVKIPNTPNYIVTSNNVLSVEKFAEEELREIGRLWTEKLVEKAAKRRKSLSN